MYFMDNTCSPAYDAHWLEMDNVVVVGGDGNGGVPLYLNGGQLDDLRVG